MTDSLPNIAAAPIKQTLMSSTHCLSFVKNSCYLGSRKYIQGPKRNIRSCYYSSFIPTTTELDSVIMTKKRNYHAMTRMMMTSSTTVDSSKAMEQKRMNCKKLLIVLAGPTAVGKSSVGAKLCSPDMASDIVTNHAIHNTIKSNNYNSEDCIPCNSISNEIIKSKGHIISADSVQVYQGVEIGANKPTKEEIEKTPHHLINIVDGDSVCQYNAADWMRDALFVIDKLTNYSPDGHTSGDYIDNNVYDYSEDQIMENSDAKKRVDRIEGYLTAQLNKTYNDGNCEQVLPVVVGGTMMYLQWLVHGRPDAMRPSEDAVKKATSTVTLFQQQQEEADARQYDIENYDNMKMTDSEEPSMGWKAALEHACSLGPIFAERVKKLPGKDWYRLRRTLEVAYTVLNDEENKDKINELYNGQRQGGLDSMEYDVRCFFLCPDDRMAHTSVVDSRCEDMILKGLIKETADLSSRGLLPPEGQQARAIGYRQTLDYLKRDNAEASDSSSFGQYLDDFTTATRRYAKKQMQWFRRDEKFMFVPVKLSDSSIDRVESSAKIIRDMCVLSRDEFDHLITPATGNNGELSLSLKTKLNNENQGKWMKLYQGKRHKLIDGSDLLRKTISEADVCTSQMQQFQLNG